LFALQVVHRVAGDIAGHQVRGELDARELAAEAFRQGANQQRLAKSGDAFEQHVAAGDQRGQHVVDHAVLADQGLLQFAAHRLRQLAGTLALLGGVVALPGSICSLIACSSRFAGGPPGD
jgi:hypothetical protein